MNPSPPFRVNLDFPQEYDVIAPNVFTIIRPVALKSGAGGVVSEA